MREMKDSGIPWVGKIPSQWKTMPGKYLFTNSKGIVGTKVNEYERLALTLHGVIKRSKNDTEGLQPAEFNTYQILRKNELVFKLIDLQNISTSRIGLSPYDGIVSPAYIILKTKKNIIPAFAEKYYLMMWINHIFNALGDSGVRSSLNAPELLEINVPVPPIEEQRRIADYLDSKCAKIKSIKKNVEAEMEVLKRYKQSVITEAVTKGLDKNVKMKDSGIPWIGKIPKDWEISRLKYVCNKISDGTHFSPTTVDNGYPYLTAKDIQGLTIDFEKAQKVNDDDFFKLKKSGCCPQKGDVLIVKDGATTGRTGMMLKQIECVLLSSVAMMHVNNLMNNFFLWYFLQSKSMQKQIESSMAGSAITRITLAKLSNYSLTCPSLKEQQRIADYLNTKCARIDSIIQKKQELLANLDTYKKSLIYEYVTGKKEVPAV